MPDKWQDVGKMIMALLMHTGGTYPFRKLIEAELNALSFAMPQAIQLKEMTVQLTNVTESAAVDAVVTARVDRMLVLCRQLKSALDTVHVAREGLDASLPDGVVDPRAHSMCQFFQSTLDHDGFKGWILRTSEGWCMKLVEAQKSLCETTKGLHVEATSWKKVLTDADTIEQVLQKGMGTDFLGTVKANCLENVLVDVDKAPLCSILVTV